jgi:hypothetical protein
VQAKKEEMRKPKSKKKKDGPVISEPDDDDIEGDNLKAFGKNKGTLFFSNYFETGLFTIAAKARLVYNVTIELLNPGER